MNILENIKKILESDPGLIIEDMSKPDEKKVVDNRFSLIMQNVGLVENKDDNFYAELIQLMGKYVDELYDYDKEIKDLPDVVFDENGEIIPQDYNELSFNDEFKLKSANRDLSKHLFDYICNTLESNKDIKLDIEIIKRLLNRNPHLFTLSVEKNYLYRTLDYKRLVKIINENQTLEKSNINIDDVYQLLFDTCQLNNDEVFGNLIKPEQFNQNHQKIDEILSECNARSFVEITDIIRYNFDKNFDRYHFTKNRNKTKFCERLIIELLNRYTDKDDYNLIHQILTNPEIEIDYDLESLDYYGGYSDLKSIIAFSDDRVVIKDFLSKEQNIQDFYIDGNHCIQLYSLYAITGDYEKALAKFIEKYNFKNDLYGEDKNLDKSGFAYGGWGYCDSLARFISNMCDSFKKDSVGYSTIVNYINRIINSENVKYINLEKTLTPIKKVLSNDDFNLLVDDLLEKHKTGNLGFISVNSHETMSTSCIIGIAGENEIQNCLSSLKEKVKKKD